MNYCTCDNYGKGYSISCPIHGSPRWAEGENEMNTKRLEEMRRLTKKGAFDSQNHAEEWAINYYSITRQEAHELAKQLDLAEVSPPSHNQINPNRW